MAFHWYRFCLWRSGPVRSFIGVDECYDSLFRSVLNYEKIHDCGPSDRRFGISFLLRDSLWARNYRAFHF